jgi:hypothetical protein
MPNIHGTLSSTGTLVGNLCRGSGTSDYEALSNLPYINDVLVIGNKPLSAYDIQPTNDYANSEDIDHLFN